MTAGNPCGVAADDTRLDPSTQQDCTELGHPGVTFNPLYRPDGTTWCLCGATSYPGRPATVDEHLACCGGPLDRFKEKRDA